MAFNFPSPANVGDIYSSEGTTFQFDGVAWNYANTTAVLAYNQANAAYARANSAAQITFGTIIANGTSIVAASNNDTLTIIANANVSIVANTSTKNIIFDITNTGVAAATYGNSTIVPVFTVDNKGRLTSVTNTSIDTTIATNAFARANDANLIANLAFDKANIANVFAVSAFARANAANLIANLAFDKANSAVLKTGNTMTGNLVMSGANIAFVTATNSGIYWGGTGLSFIYSPAANTLVIGTSLVEDVRIDASGNVGIATTSPVAKLDVSGSFSVAKANVLNQTLTYGANAFTNWNASLGQVATVTLTGSNTTLNVATNLRVGTYILHVIQDATGNRLITFGSGYKFTGAFSPPLTSNANARDIFSFISDGTNMYGVMVPDVR